MAQAQRGRSRRSTGATVDQPAYSEGSGFKAGQTAPSTKYRTIDGKVVDKLPKGEGGWVVVNEGETVAPHVARELDVASSKSDDSDDADDSDD